MTAIWKFTLNTTSYTFEIPKGAKVLSVAVQYGDICLWMEVDKTQPLEKREFIVVQAGMDLPDGNKQFIGTVLTNGGATVLHVYEIFDSRVLPDIRDVLVSPNDGDKCMVCGKDARMEESLFWVGDGHVHVNCVDSINENLKQSQRILGAIDFAVQYAQIDGAHHKAWVIDHMVRILAGGDYEKVIEAAKNGEDGPNTYDWDEGIAP